MKSVPGMSLLALFMAGNAMASPHQATFSSDRLRTSIFDDGAAQYTTPAPPPPGMSVIFNNIGKKYPNGEYFCCDGLTVAGPDSYLGQETWPAIAFTPATDVTVKVVDAGVGYDNGGPNDVVISIAADTGGLPGTVLGSTHVTGLGDFGDCCKLARAKFTGVKLSAGQQYWVIVGTDDQDTATVAAWSFNSTEQMQTVRFAENYGSGWQLINATARPAPSFAVYGK